jgi:hypothetical protein
MADQTTPGQSLSLSKTLSDGQMQVQALMAALCVTHNRVLTDQMLGIYSLTLLSALSPEQVKNLIPKSLKECRFWPSAAELLVLAGVPTESEKMEQDALAGLAKFLNVLRDLRHMSTELRDKRLDELKVPPHSEKPITKTLVKFGGGNLEAAVELLLQHPSLRQSGDEVSGFGLDFNSVQKCEQRWVSCWKSVAQ